MRVDSVELAELNGCSGLVDRTVKYLIYPRKFAFSCCKSALGAFCETFYLLHLVVRQGVFQLRRYHLIVFEDLDCKPHGGISGKSIVRELSLYLVISADLFVFLFERGNVDVRLFFKRSFECSVEPVIRFCICRREHHDRNTDLLFYCFRVDSLPLLFRNVLHIQHKKARCGKSRVIRKHEQASFELGAVRENAHNIRLAGRNEVTGYDLLVRVRGHAVGTGKVGYGICIAAVGE